MAKKKTTKVARSIRLDEKLDKGLADAAAAMDRSINWVIQDAVSEYLKARFPEKGKRA